MLFYVIFHAGVTIFDGNVAVAVFVIHQNLPYLLTSSAQIALEIVYFCLNYDLQSS